MRTLRRTTPPGPARDGTGKSGKGTILIVPMAAKHDKGVSP